MHVITYIILFFSTGFHFIGAQPANIARVVLIPFGKSKSIECDGKYGGSYQWTGHDFTIILPPNCADGTVTITVEAYLPSGALENCFVSAVFFVHTNIKVFKKSITIQFPHWLNIKSETDKANLCFINIAQNRAFEVKKGSFEVGKSSGSIDVTEVCQISICNNFGSKCFTLVKAQHYQSELVGFPLYNGMSMLLKSDEGNTSKSITEYKYLDILLLPEYDKKWGIYCIAIDNPTYLQVQFKYMCTYVQPYINML